MGTMSKTPNPHSQWAIHMMSVQCYRKWMHVTWDCAICIPQHEVTFGSSCHGHWLQQVVRADAAELLMVHIPREYWSQVMESGTRLMTCTTFYLLDHDLVQILFTETLLHKTVSVLSSELWRAHTDAGRSESSQTAGRELSCTSLMQMPCL